MEFIFGVVFVFLVGGEDMRLDEMVGVDVEAASRLIGEERRGERWGRG